MATIRPGDSPARTNGQAAEPYRTIESLLTEERRYAPSPEFAAQANVNDPTIYERAAADPEAFWGEMARVVDWHKPFDRVLDWDVPWAKWYVGGQLNACYNCVDRHLKTWRRNKAAIIWEGEPGEERVLTYRDLYREVNRAAVAALTSASPSISSRGGRTMS